MYDRVADLPLRITSVGGRRHERETASGFTRVTTEVVLRGRPADGTGGTVAGRGEDVTYEATDHDTFDPSALALTGEYTVDAFSTHLDDIDLFPEPPEREPSRHYRRWAVESAALDLALRQAGTDLGGVLGRTYDPVRFVVSPALASGDDGPSIEPVRRLREHHPAIEFKLDPTPDWEDALIDALAATDAVRVLDLKGYYEGTDVDNPADPDLYERVLAAFPDAVVEDALETDETRPVLADNRDRLSWDYPITGVASIRDLPVEPSWLNCKPSRFGTVESLFSTIAYCEREGIHLYGGGQFELGVGREQIQALASLCYAEAPNDVAPGGYNDPEPDPDLPDSPCVPTEPTGFGF